MSELEQLREKLKLHNIALFNLIQSRRETVTSIQGLKSGSIYCPEREFEVAQTLNTKNLSMHELLAFSLLWEGQALESGDYPRWSQRAHLESPQGESFEQINPALLYFYDRSLFDQLNFTNSFQKVFNSLSKEKSEES